LLDNDALMMMMMLTRLKKLKAIVACCTWIRTRLSAILRSVYSFYDSTILLHDALLLVLYFRHGDAVVAAAVNKVEYTYFSTWTTVQSCWIDLRRRRIKQSVLLSGFYPFYL
jgi:hypothetical protein